MELFDSSFLSSLKQLHLVMRKKFVGRSLGNRLTKRRGGSADFADYKEYQPGDDLRFLDWNLYARLERLYIKLFHNQESLDVLIILDNSASMKFGEREKFRFARQIAGAIGYLSLHFQDRVRITPLFGDSGRHSPLLHGGAGVKKLFHYLEQIGVAEEEETPRLETFFQQNRRGGLVFFLSDFMFDYQEILRKLTFHKHQLHAIQILDREEVAPDFAGHFILEDGESGEELDIDLDSEILKNYRQEMENYNRQLEGFCQSKGHHFRGVTTEYPLTSLLLNLFDRRGR